MLKCKFETITFSKFGNSIDENEDNVMTPNKSEIESANIVRFAISDGATEASFSKEWSDLLVSSYNDNFFDIKNFQDTLIKISASWNTVTSSIKLPWYAEQKAETGSFATFTGITINICEETFKAVAIGDCNLFQIRDSVLLNAFPNLSVEDFGNTPNLLATNQKYQTDLTKNVLYHKGTIKSNDIILLTTDALAAWIFTQIDLGAKPWNHLLNLIENYKGDFENWLNNKRSENEIKNDDVTLVIIKFE